MGRRAVIFDLDGTLLNTIEDLADAMNAALLANGLPARPDVREHKLMVGDGVDRYVLRAMPSGKGEDGELVARVRADYRAAYARGWRNKTRPYDGVLKLLEDLARRGVRPAVLSNKPDDTTRATVEALLGLERFEVVRGAVEGAPLKPDPAGALSIARQMHLPAPEFAYVGDTAIDMETATAVGMFAIGALWGFRGAEELLAGGAQVLAEAPADVLGLLNS